jgi:hypothetical protein
MIKVNKKAQQKNINEAYAMTLETIQTLANDGQERYTINLSLPNYNDGWEVFNLLEKDGVEICESGFKAQKCNNGSYYFTVNCKIK